MVSSGLRPATICRLLLLVGLAVGLAACDPSSRNPDHPVGRWEFVGELPDGFRGIVRVEIQPGPFVKYLGFREHMEPLAPAAAQALASDLERRWFLNPEMLMQFQEPWIRGYGGETDGVDFFFWEEETNSLISHREDSEGRKFMAVEDFTPFRFPVGN